MSCLRSKNGEVAHQNSLIDNTAPREKRPRRRKPTTAAFPDVKNQDARDPTSIPSPVNVRRTRAGRRQASKYSRTRGAVVAPPKSIAAAVQVSRIHSPFDNFPRLIK